MADKKETTKPALPDAQKNYAAAAAAYQKLVDIPTRTMKPDALAAHNAACRTALRDKRYAAAVLNSMLNNRPVPKKEDLAECKE